MKKILFNSAKFLIGFLFLFLILRFLKVDNINRILQVNYLYITLCFIVTMLSFLTDTVRWKLISDEIAGRKTASFLSFLSIYLRTISLGQFISQSGSLLVARPIYMRKKYNFTYKESFITLFIEKVADLYYVFVFFLIFLFNFFFNNHWITLSILLFFISSLIFVYKIQKIEKYIYWILKKIGKIKKKNVNIDLKKLEFHSYKKLAILSIIRFFAYGLRFFLLAKAINLSISYTDILLGMPIAQLSLIFAFTPGALGVLEAGWSGVLKIFQYSNNTIGYFVLGFRFYWIVFSLVIYIISYVIKDKKK